MTFHVTYDIHELKRNYLRILFRRWPILLGAVALIAWSTWEGYRQGFLGAPQVIGWTVIAILALKYGAAYLRYTRMLKDWARREGGLTATFEVNDDSLGMETGFGSSQVKWGSFQWVQRTGNLLLLGLPQHQWLTLPLEQIPAGDREAIRVCLLNVGVKEKGKARFLLSST